MKISCINCGKLHAPSALSINHVCRSCIDENKNFDFIDGAFRKQCRHCGEHLELSEFNAHKRSKDGLQSWCKSCTSEYQAAKYADKKAKERAETDRLIESVGSVKKKSDDSDVFDVDLKMSDDLCRLDAITIFIMGIAIGFIAALLISVNM